MESSGDSQSIARAIAVDVMRALGLDHINDFRTRDKIICAIGSRVDQTLDAAVALHKSLTPEQVERAKKAILHYDRHVYEKAALGGWSAVIELLREVVGNDISTT